MMPGIQATDQDRHHGQGPDYDEWLKGPKTKK
jgi:hypothetical protein